MSRQQFSVIADDLTGAGDTGVQFSKAGLQTRILHSSWEPGDITDADILVAQTESRALLPDAAYAAVRAHTEKLVKAGVSPIYKKVDSTLRGRIGNELDAVMDVSGQKIALVCPAFPANNRILVGGYLLVDGELVSRTAIGVDPVSPVTESHIPTLLAAQSQRPIHSVTGSDIAKGAGHVASLFAKLAASEGGIIVADAVKEGDLSLLEEAMHDACPSALYVGSAGLAAPLAARMGKAMAGGRPVLAVVGSVNPVSRGQLKLLQQAGMGMFLITAEELLADDASWSASLPARSAELATHLKEGKDMAVATPGNREEVDSIIARGASLDLSNLVLTERIAVRATEVAYKAIQTLGLSAVSGLILTGGDMAQAMLDHLGARGINLIAEVSPGIPAGSLSGPGVEGIKVVTKAGGFGAPDALVRAAKLLREMK